MALTWEKRKKKDSKLLIVVACSSCGQAVLVLEQSVRRVEIVCAEGRGAVVGRGGAGG
jgi:phosphoenolpyruvate carboxylase